ncbi:hypothetical protein H70357_14480 [Paenibacillus sp. FSL H7-0357]|uniref:DUF2785 domain-containing protein n=1 Tax=Paenibacillus sp. FSL H7-0357 TaxID=1536774 RepID=UPI0004F737C4|nr:DUF2785 domain-containing protein [Paenibacillus sp. FSL H7-0357]AIQ17731.1 hypothetical protein H70357_14480 [Paenibacillus sp. FSL H7-0357]
MTDTRNGLKLDLQRIEEEHYQLRDGEVAGDYISRMLEYIGDPDPELRDLLIYPTFYEWISEQQLFTADELRSLLGVLTDERHLFYDIGGSGDQSVFTRTFSVLPAALIIQQHRLQPFLEEADFMSLKDSLLRYYRTEKDLRGYLEENGWAHAAAHAADALDELVKCPESDAAVQLEVLDAVQGMLQNGTYIFNEEEDERIATIVDSMVFHSLLPEEQLAGWISALGECGSLPRTRSVDINRINCKNFLRALYFRRGSHIRGQQLEEAFMSAEINLNKFTMRSAL